MCLLLAQLIIGFFSFSFLLRPFPVLKKKTRAIKQSIFLDVYGPNLGSNVFFSKRLYKFMTGKEFIVTLKAECNKTFYVRKLRMFLIIYMWKDWGLTVSARTTKGGSIIVLFTSCLTGLD
jgi:hypothetical protein